MSVAIEDPWGRIVAEADGSEPGVIVAEIDTAAAAAARKKIPNLKNARDFTLRHAAAQAERLAAQAERRAG